MKIVSLIGAGAFALVFSLIYLAQPSHSVAASPSGAQLYSQNCSRCHKADGTGRRGARNLTSAEWQDRVADERIFNSINNGKGRMPAFSKKLSEAQIDELVRYVRGLKR
jgi:cytochrome c6